MKDHSAIIICHNNKVLFIQRSSTKKTLPNIWAFPSGTVEAGETLEQTTVREAQEELGIDVTVEKEIAVMELPEFDVRLHFIVCLIAAGEPVITDTDEIQTIKWMTFSEFFDQYTDEQIGHGLIWLRQHPEILRAATLDRK